MKKIVMIAFVAVSVAFTACNNAKTETPATSNEDSLKTETPAVDNAPATADSTATAATDSTATEANAPA